MALPLVGTSSGGYVTGTSRATSLPTGLVKGDVLVLDMEFDGDQTSAAGSGMWGGKVGSVFGGNSVSVVGFLATYHPAGVDGVSTAPTITWGGTSIGTNWIMTAWRGYKMHDATAVGKNTTTDTAPTLPAVITTVDNDLIIGDLATYSGGTFTVGGGLTLAGTDGSGHHVLYKIAGAAGSTGTMACSCATSTYWYAITTALKPVVVPVPGVAYWGLRGNLVAGGGGGPPAGTTVWKGDGSADLKTQWAEFSNNDQPGGTLVTSSGSIVFPSTRLSVDTSFKPAGLGQALKFQVFDGDNSYGERSEVGQGNPFRNDWDVSNGNNKAGASSPHMWYQGDDYWIGSQVYVPAGFPTPSWQAIHQFKHIDDGDGGPLIIGLSDVGSGPQWEWSSSNSRDYTDSSQTTVQRFSAASSFGRWNQWLVHIKFSDDNTIGFYDVWADINGSGLINLVPKTFTYTMCRDESTGILKPSHARIGIYRNPIVSTTSTLWIAGYNVATTKELAAYNAGITLP